MLTAEITDVAVKNSGEKFQGKMHSISAKMILKNAGVVIFEQTFSENHKEAHLISNTMETLKIRMDTAKEKIEAELIIKVEAEKEIPAMLISLNEVK